MRLLRVLSAFASTPWALELGRLQALAQLLERADAEAEVQAFAEARSDRPSSGGTGAKQNVAVIPVYGVIAHRAHMVQDICGPGGTSTEMLTAAINAAVDDPTVRSIVLDVDSPGGSVFGVLEVADAIYQAREKKPIAAVANATAASAAYWIASAAHEIFVTPSGMVGSIGVFGQHVDTSKPTRPPARWSPRSRPASTRPRAWARSPTTPATHMQSMIDGYYTQFVKAVARNRGVSVDAVRNGYGQGRTLTAGPAKDAGMVDGIATLDEVIQKYAGARRDRERADQGARRGPDSNRRRPPGRCPSAPNASSPPKRTPR
jgi:ClpP class serine protease